MEETGSRRCVWLRYVISILLTSFLFSLLLPAVPFRINSVLDRRPPAAEPGPLSREILSLAPDDDPDAIQQRYRAQRASLRPALETSLTLDKALSQLNSTHHNSTELNLSKQSQPKSDSRDETSLGHFTDPALRPPERFRATRTGSRVKEDRQEKRGGDAPPTTNAPPPKKAPAKGQTKTQVTPLWNRNSPDASSQYPGRCEQEVRLKQVKSSCEKYAQTGSPFANVDKLKSEMTFRGILVDDVHKTLYCEVPKAACTSWKVFFAQLSGKVLPGEQKILHNLVHDTTYHPSIGFKYLDAYSPEERQHRIDTYYKFMVVRSPFSRLLSAYKNKLKDKSTQSQWYHENIGRYIVKKYREGEKSKQPAGDDVTFREFVRFIANKDEHHSQRYDPHFWNMQSVCWPCLIKYDFIAKVETMEKDSEAIIHRIAPHRNLTLPYLNHKTQPTKKSDQLKEYYDSIPDNILTDLSKIYKEDHEMFGYRMDGKHRLACDANGCC